MSTLYSVFSFVVGLLVLAWVLFVGGCTVTAITATGYDELVITADGNDGTYTVEKENGITGPLGITGEFEGKGNIIISRDDHPAISNSKYDCWYGENLRLHRNPHLGPALIKKGRGGCEIYAINGVEFERREDAIASWDAWEIEKRVKGKAEQPRSQYRLPVPPHDLPPK